MDRKILKVTATLVFAVTLLFDLQAQENYQQGAFYVRFRHRPVSLEKVKSVKALSRKYDLRPVMTGVGVFADEFLDRTFIVEFGRIDLTDELMDVLMKLPEVESVERVSACSITGNAYEGAEDPLYMAGAPYNWHLDLIHAEEAWQRQSGSPDVVVAVIDNAVWGEHPDLQIPSSRQYNIMTDKNHSAPPSGVDQNAECSNPDRCKVYGWSHGTHCAGLIGAINNNGTGIKSIGSGVSVMGVACQNTQNPGDVIFGYKGISYAAEHGAKVISCSWGSTQKPSPTEKAIVQACIDNGIVVVAAAGNNGKNQQFYPGALPGVISVAAVNSDKNITVWNGGGSNYGNWVSVAAPGGFWIEDNRRSEACVFSTTFCQSQYYRLNGYHVADGQYYDGMYGSSMATPVVAGLCGLLLSADTSLNAYKIRELLRASSQPLAEGQTPFIQEGSGVVDASASLELLKNHLPVPRNLQATVEDRTVRLTWDAPVSEEPVKYYEVYGNGILLMETEILEYTQEVATSGIYRYGVAAVSDSGTSLRVCMDIEVDGNHSSLAESASEALSFKLYPNPAAKEVFIESDGSYTVNVYTLSGTRILTSETLMDFGTRLCIENLCAGVYIVELRHGLRTGYQKLIVR